MSAAAEPQSNDEPTTTAAVESGSEVSEWEQLISPSDPKVSELEFRIDNVTKYKVGESVESSSEMIELFNYRLKVYPMGKVENNFAVYLQRVPMNGIDPRGVYKNVGYEVSLENHWDSSEPLTKRRYCEWFRNSQAHGWNKFLDEELRPKKFVFFTDEGSIVIKARVYLNHSKLVLAAADPHDEDIWIGKVTGFEKGEDVKFKPTWRGNYRIQIAVYPGGHPDHLDGEEALAVYIHVLGKQEVEAAPEFLKLKVAVVNHQMLGDSIEWVGTFRPEEVGDDSWGPQLSPAWGPNRLLSIEDLRDEAKGWLDEDGELLLRASVEPADEGRDPLSFTKSFAKKRRATKNEEAAQGRAKSAKTDE
ncbi:hypothetical protein FOZ60_000666 [Perkinsus olseni]|uniref:MATH domain-containing protein n=2 Tax=Perkinsus olseni TaxID=32597 RepID=A0A7J6P2X8_PEROL|nr:hypothetical protein FOZ60_000666 [Perkinsus olseni]